MTVVYYFLSIILLLWYNMSLAHYMIGFNMYLALLIVGFLFFLLIGIGYELWILTHHQSLLVVGWKTLHWWINTQFQKKPMINLMVSQKWVFQNKSNSAQYVHLQRLSYWLNSYLIWLETRTHTKQGNTREQKQ